MTVQCGDEVYPDICVNTWSPAAHYGEARGRAGAEEEASVIKRDPGSVGEDAPAERLETETNDDKRTSLNIYQTNLVSQITTK